MDNRIKAFNVYLTLNRMYKDAPNLVVLNWETPFQLLIAGILSARSKDIQVNLATKDLFKRFKIVDDFANADVDEVRNYISNINFCDVKAERVVKASQMIRDRFNGQVPDNIGDLIKLPGVGRKVANLVVGDAFGKPAVVCDTHCIRVSNRLGLADSEDPTACERDLRRCLLPGYSTQFCHLLVHFGREYCRASNPQCADCPISTYCIFK